MAIGNIIHSIRNIMRKDSGVDGLMKFCDDLEEKIKKNKTNSEKLMGAVLREVFEE